MRPPRRVLAPGALLLLTAAAAVLATGLTRETAGGGTRGLSAPDARAIRGYEGWTRLRGRPRADLRSLGSAHPGVKRIFVNQPTRRLAPTGRQRYPFPVGSTIVKAGRSGGELTLIAIMRKVARTGTADGGWDFVEYQRSSASERFARVGGGEGVCTGCHSIAQRRQRTDWTFDTLR
jgi:hypothetical protein